MMKKIFLLILGFVMFKVGYSQYPIQQFIGADSAVVTSKGGLQGRLINQVFTDTSQANTQRIRQYPGAMIYAGGKMWVRNTTATGWTELAYGPISSSNIYNSNGTLTGNRELDGDGYNLDFTAVNKFSFSGDSLYYLLDPTGNLRLKLGNQQFTMQGDTASLAQRISYTGNLSSSFTKHTLIDKNYVDSIGVLRPTGSGTTNYLPKWTGSSALGNSLIQDDGTNVGIGITPATYKFRVSGNAFSSSYFVGTTSNTLDQFKSGGLISFASSGTSSYTQIGYDASLNAGWISAVTEGSAYRPIILGYSSNVGISTTAAPVSRLEIQAAQFPAITLRKTGIGTWTIGNRTESTGTNFNISYGTTDILNVTAAGRVLIGTTTESTYELDVVGDIRSTLDANINGLTVGKGGGSVATNTAVGFEALLNNGTGIYTTAIGYQAARSMTSGTSVMIGYEAGRAVTTGDGQLLIGYRAGKGITTGANNIIIGNGAGEYSATTISQNVLIGNGVGQSALSSSQNVLIGHNTGNLLESGGGNVFIGRQTGVGITTGANNTIIGANVSGLSSSLSNTIILADGQGNQRIVVNSSGNTTNNGDLTIPRNNKFRMKFADIYSDGFELYLNDTPQAYIATPGVPALNIVVNSGSIATFQSTLMTLRGDLNISGGTGGSIYNTGSFRNFNMQSNGAGTIGRTAASPAYSFYGDLTTGMWMPAFGSLDWSISGVSAMRLSTGSNLLIGTTTDVGYKLDVNGKFRAQSFILDLSGSIQYVNFTSASSLFTTSSSSFYHRFDNGSQSFYIASDKVSTSRRFDFLSQSTDPTAGTAGVYYNSTDNALRIYNGTNWQNILAPNSSGNVGIGTTSPNASALLDLTSTTKGLLLMRMTGTEAEAISTPADGLVVYINNGNGTTITSTGFWGRDAGAWVKLN